MIEKVWEQACNQACWIFEAYQEHTSTGVWISIPNAKQPIGSNNSVEFQGLLSQISLSKHTEHSES